MGFAGKVLVFGLLAIAAWYAYENVKIDAVTVCVDRSSTVLDVTCVDDSDCAKYLTSQYGSYPDSPMYQYLVREVSTCSLGVCEIKNFEFRDVCSDDEQPIVYRVTAKELVSVI